MKFDYELQKPVGKKILVAVSSARDWKPQFGICFPVMFAQTIRLGAEIDLVTLDLRAGVHQSNLAMARQASFDSAMYAEKGYTHIATFDDDMQFPFDTLLRLAKHNLPFVCANVAQKVPGKVNGVCLDMVNQSRIDSTGKTGLEQISYGTLACTLIEVDAYRAIPHPHFEMMWVPDKQIYKGEDHYFMQLLGRAGVPFFCDHDLSQEVHHIGDYAYGFTPSAI